MKPRELAYCGLFGAAAMVMPALFHLLHLGHVFLPMYLPLVPLAFVVGPGPAVLTAATVPLLSGALTGMPPFWPPVGPFMAAELATACGLIATARRWWPRGNEWAILVPALLAGRLVYLGLVFAFARFVALPAGFLAGASLLAGWPGLVLLVVAVPPTVRFLGRGRAA